MSPGRITTFYSYKGGVGRSMAVANLAVVLARRARRVLVVDFDLDAPGIHRYFPDPSGSGRSGVIDLFVELRSELELAFPGAGDFDPTDRDAIAKCQKLVAALLDRDDLFQSVALAPHLRVLRAGRFDADYAERVRTFDWAGLFGDFAEVFGELRMGLCARYDDVLIDSRTGLTDIGSVSTVVLPDRLVVAFVPNEQSLAGGVEVAQQATALHAQILESKRSSKPLQIIPLLSRVEPAELEERASWMKRAADQYTSLFSTLGADSGSMLRFFEDMHVPHIAYYAYGERIAVAEGKGRGIGSMVDAYERFADYLLFQGSLTEWLSHGTRDRALLARLDGGPSPPELPQQWGFQQIFHVPGEGSTRDFSSLRKIPVDVEAWKDAMAQVEREIMEATRGLRGNLHVFPMSPYPIAALLGRRLDDLARSTPVYLYQYDSTAGEWVLFSSPGLGAGEEPFFCDVEEAPTGGLGSDVVVAIEGFRQINDDTLRAFGQGVGAGSFVRLRQMRDTPLDLRSEAGRAVRDVRRALARVQSARPSAGLHIVATAPVALIVEVGRMLSPNVYRKAAVYQYEPASASYVAGLDVIGRTLIGA